MDLKEMSVTGVGSSREARPQTHCLVVRVCSRTGELRHCERLSLVPPQEDT